MPLKTHFYDDQDFMKVIDELTSQDLIPETLVLDHGPAFVSKSAQSVSKPLSAQLEITPRYRPDWKALIERHFKTMNTTFIKSRGNGNTSPANS